MFRLKHLYFCARDEAYWISCLIRYIINNQSRRRACRLVSRYLSRRYMIAVFPVCSIKLGSNLKLPHPQNIVIGSGSVIGDNVTIYHDVTLGQNRGLYPTIGSNVILYPGAKIIGGVTIGDNSVIGANALVNRDIPPWSVAAGVPAKIVRRRLSEDEFF